ncbi:ECF-type sigma factor [Haliangium sp.]|uniref:ECF-type sigma factor n=1 Tax=Haliangium sp. TaxID=2663208 RepID=UPI003D101697
MTNDCKSPEDPLTQRLYAELRKIAKARLRKLPPNQTLQATELVAEAWMRLRGQDWESRRHFLGAAARAMRFILVEHARRRRAVKHGGEMQRVDVMVTLPGENRARALDDVLAVHDALEALTANHPVAAQVVELRFFGGLTMREIEEELGLGRGAVERKWQFARAWLGRALSHREPDPNPATPTSAGL